MQRGQLPENLKDQDSLHFRRGAGNDAELHFLHDLRIAQGAKCCVCARVSVCLCPCHIVSAVVRISPLQPPHVSQQALERFSSACAPPRAHVPHGHGRSATESCSLQQGKSSALSRRSDSKSAIRGGGGWRRRERRWRRGSHQNKRKEGALSSTAPAAL